MTDSSSWVCVSSTPPVADVTLTVLSLSLFVSSDCEFFRTVNFSYSPSWAGTFTLTVIPSQRTQLPESGSIISTLWRQVDRGRICQAWHYVCIHRQSVSKTNCNQQAETASKFAYRVPFIVYLFPMKSVIINI